MVEKDENLVSVLVERRDGDVLQSVGLLKVDRIRLVVQHGIVKHQECIPLGVFEGTVFKVLQLFRHLEEAHRVLDDLGIIGRNVIGHWIVEDETRVLLDEMLDYVGDDLAQRDLLGLGRV